MQLDVSELVKHGEGVIEQLNQSFRHRLDSPLTKIPERYTESGGAVALKVMCDLGGAKFGMFTLINLQDFAHLRGQNDCGCSNADDEFSVLIENVEIVDQTKGIVRRVGGFIGLKSFDKTSDIWVRDSFYFSFKSSAFVRAEWLFQENWELDSSNVLYFPRVGEMPNNVVKAGSKVMNRLSGKHTEAWRDSAIRMILGGLAQHLSVVLWDKGVVAFLKEPLHFEVEIADVLFGPF